MSERARQVESRGSRLETRGSDFDKVNSADCIPPIRNPQSAIRNPQFLFNSQFAIRNPQSAPSSKIPVAVLGATGAVGQRFVQLLADHPWFELAAVAASDQSAGRPYGDACRWMLSEPMPAAAAGLTVRPLRHDGAVPLVFSALPADVAGPVEDAFAGAGCAVVTNAAAHRRDPDVPLLIPEVNPGHAALVERQRARRGGPGFIAAHANCSTAQVALALRPLHDAFGLERVAVTTLQAVSGAGYPGLPALDILGNVIPFIPGEEDKLEREPRKLLGELGPGGVADAPFAISAQCNRVPVADGHTACVSLAFARETRLEEVAEALASFRAGPEIAALPSSPDPPLVLRTEPDRPQPARDRNAGGGMAVSVGRIRRCPLFHVKMVILGHNTLRGAAGGAIHLAELLTAQGYIG
jgi:aspartate-semialdehyde dehydrogenase